MPSFRSFLRPDPASAESEAAALQRLERLSVFLDSALRVPVIGTRIGADALLNFIPGAGVLFAKSLSAYIIWEAHRLGIPRRTLGKMLANLGIDFGISMVPLAGWVGDAFFRANLRNLSLLKAHLHERRASGWPQTRSRKAAPVIDGQWVRNPA